MARIEVQAVIAVPPVDVFDYRLDFGSNLVAYNPNVREVVQIEGDGPGVGSKYRVRVRLGPGFTADTTICVTEVVPASEVRDVAEAFIHADETVSFDPVSLPDGRTGTQVRFVVSSNPRGLVSRLVDALLVPILTRRQVRTELRRMRKNLEARARS
jgi:uncharacterized membrane protein